jgi:hypothetical protein
MFKDDASVMKGLWHFGNIQKRRTKISRQARETGAETLNLSNVLKLIKTYFHWNSNPDLNFWRSFGVGLRPNYVYLLKSTTRCCQMAKDVRRTPMNFRFLREAN